MLIRPVFQESFVILGPVSRSRFEAGIHNDVALASGLFPVAAGELMNRANDLEIEPVALGKSSESLIRRSTLHPFQFATLGREPYRKSKRELGGRETSFRAFADTGL